MATVLTNAGRACITKRLAQGLTQPDIRYVAWGTGAGTSAVGDTALFTEAIEARTAGGMNQVTTSVTNDTYQIDGAIQAVASRAITEVGVFDTAKAQSGSPTGNLCVHGDFAVINLAANDSLNFTVKIQLQ